MQSLETVIKDHQIKALTHFKSELNSSNVSIAQITYTNADKQEATIEVNNDLATIITKLRELSEQNTSISFVYTSDSYPNLRLSQDVFVQTDFEGLDTLSENPIAILGGYDCLDDYENNRKKYTFFQNKLIDICDEYTDMTTELFHEVCSDYDL